MGDQIYSPVMQVFTSDGDPGVGYKLYTYESGTTTPKAVYTDEACTVAAANPVVFNSRGEATIYYADEYKFILKTDADVTVWTVDSVGTAATSSSSTTYSYYPDPDESDQGATASGSGDTIYDILDTIGTSEFCKIVLRHNGDANTTDYTFDTSLDATNYTKAFFEVQPGARLVRTTGDEYLTLPTPGHLIAAQSQPVTAVDILRFDGSGTVYPEWWGAVHDGTTDDGAEIRNAVSAVSAGSTIAFLNGTYAVTGTTGIPITTAINIEMATGCKLLFSNDSTVYVEYTSVTGFSVRGLTIDAGTPSVRGTEPALSFNSCNETFVDGLRVLSAAGAGYLVHGGNEHHIQNSHVQGTLADGYHWTYQTTRFTGQNLTAEDTGDDSFAVIGYVADGGRCSNGNLTGLVSHDSTANGLKIAGGDNIFADIVVDSPGVHGVIIQKDTTYNTYSSQYCKVSAVVDSPTENGINITNDANDIDVNAIVNNATARGWNIGASSTTVERIRVSGEAYSSGSDGIQATYVDDLTIDQFISSENYTHGYSLGVINRLNTGVLHAYNNNTQSNAASDNVYLFGLDTAVIGGVLAVDDRTPAQVHRAIDVVNCDDVTFGPIKYSGAVHSYPVYVNQTNCTGILYSSRLPVTLTLAANDATPSVVGFTRFLTANSSATTVTTFDGATDGQRIIVFIGDANTTFDFTGGGDLKGNGGSDWTPGSGDWLEAEYNGTYWYCAVHEI
jgi:hypothetical protein